MSRYSSTGTGITQVVMNTDAMMPDSLKFPGGFVGNVHADNRDLMQQAADTRKFKIEFRAPRNADPERFLGVYTDLKEADPKLLLHDFFTLLLARSNAKEHRIHEMAKSKKRRRKRA